jgi:hypothetical protein
VAANYEKDHRIKSLLKDKITTTLDDKSEYYLKLR